MRHFYQTIPGWFSFRGLYTQAVKEACDGAHFVEVGCWKGRSTAFMAVEIINSGKLIHFHCVDTWEGSQEPKHQSDDSVKNGTLYAEFLRNIAPVTHRINKMRMKSVDAARCFKDESLAFIFIDAAHDYANVLADIEAWRPKVRPGGILAGDDAEFQGVRKALKRAFFKYETIPGSGTGVQWRARKIC